MAGYVVATGLPSLSSRPLCLGWWPEPSAEACAPQPARCMLPILGDASASLCFALLCFPFLGGTQPKCVSTRRGHVGEKRKTLLQEQGQQILPESH